ncbi:MAG: hypothetical protein ABI353_11365 [Isosphaeraceae bacterium]
MPTPTIEAMAERLERLERECRRWRRAGVGLALLGAVVLTLVAVRKDEGPKTVEAERFLLKDQKGTIRGEWGFVPKTDWPNFCLNSVNGKHGLSMVMVGGVEDSYQFLLHNKKGVAHLRMGVLGDGKPWLSFLDEHGAIEELYPSGLNYPVPPAPVGTPLRPPPPPPEPAPGPADPANRTQTQ